MARHQHRHLHLRSEAVAEILRRNEEIIAETYGRRPGYRAFCLAAEALA